MGLESCIEDWKSLMKFARGFNHSWRKKDLKRSVKSRGWYIHPALLQVVAGPGGRVQKYPGPGPAALGEYEGILNPPLPHNRLPARFITPPLAFRHSPLCACWCGRMDNLTQKLTPSGYPTSRLRGRYMHLFSFLACESLVRTLDTMRYMHLFSPLASLK